MLNFFRPATKKEPGTTSGGNNPDLDDFLGKSAGKDAPISAAPSSSSTTTNSKGHKALKSDDIDLGPEDLGLVIRDLDKERENLAQKQAVSTENDPAQGPRGPVKRETAQTSSVANASDHVGESSREEDPDSGEIVRSDKSFPSLDNQGEKSAEHEDRSVTSDVAQSSHNEYRRGDDAPTHVTIDEPATDLQENEATPSAHSDENLDLDQQAAGTEQNNVGDADSLPAGVDEVAFTDLNQEEEGPEDAAWEPRNLDEEVASQDGNGGYLSDDDTGLHAHDELRNEDGYEETYSGDEAHDAEDVWSNNSNDDAQTPTRSSEISEARSDMDDTQFDEPDGATTPAPDEVGEMDRYSDLDDPGYGNSDGHHSDIDETPDERNDIIDAEEELSDPDQEHDGKYGSQRWNEESDFDDNAELSDEAHANEEALDQVDDASQVEDDASEHDASQFEDDASEYDASQFEEDASEHEVGEHSENLDEYSDGASEFAEESSDREREEQNSFISEDPLEGDADLEGNEDLEQDKDLGGDISADQDEHGDHDDYADQDEDLTQGDEIEQDPDLEQDDHLESADEQTVLSGSAADQEGLSDQGSDMESQADPEESSPETPPCVPIDEWTEEHIEAFKVHFRPKANIFDFLARKGVANRERLSGVVAEALKLCLRDSKALRGKTHATVFLEAGGTPLGPFLAFLALTIQSTITSTKEEKSGKGNKDAKEEKYVEGEDEAGETGDEQPPPGAEEPDPWDDLDLDDDLEAPPSHFEPPKPGYVAPAVHSKTHGKRPEVATNVMVVMFLQAVLESSRAALSGPATAYLEWTFIYQDLEINSSIACCKGQNDGSLHEKRSKRTAHEHLTWEDANPLEYVSIGAQEMYSKQHYIHSEDAKIPVAAQMISMICERVRASNAPLSEYDRTTFVITSTSTAISFAYAVFPPEYIQRFQLGGSRPSASESDLDDDVIEPEPELKIFESSPYDLSQWDEALEAAELALGLVEFLQREGPLLAGSTQEDSPIKETSLQGEKSSASPSSLSGGRRGRFPIKVGPRHPEEPAPVEELAASEDDAEKMSGDELPTLTARDHDEDLEQDGDSDKESGDDRVHDDRSENEGDRPEDGALDESFTDNPHDEGGPMKEEVTDEEGRNEGDGAYGDEDFEDDADRDGTSAKNFTDDEALDEENAFDSELQDDAIDGDLTDGEERLTEDQLEDEDMEYEAGDGEEHDFEGEAETEAEESMTQDGLESQAEDVYQDESAYDDAYGDSDYLSNDLGTPYPNELNEARRSDDHASMYDEDRYLSETSSAMGNHYQDEVDDDDYISEENVGGSFDDDASETATQVGMNRDDFCEEGSHDNFRHETWHDDSQGELDDEYISESNEDDFVGDMSANAIRSGNEDDYLSGDDYGERFPNDNSENALQTGTEDDYISGDDHPENYRDDVSENDLQARTDDDHISGDDHPENFRDDVSENDLQVGTEDNYLSGDDHDGDFLNGVANDDNISEENYEDYDDEPIQAGVDDRYASEDNGGELQDDRSENATRGELDDTYASEDNDQELRDDYSDSTIEADVDYDYLPGEHRNDFQNDSLDNPTQADVDGHYLSEEDEGNFQDNFSDDATQAGIDDEEFSLRKDFADEDSYIDYENDLNAAVREEAQTLGMRYDDNSNAEPWEKTIPHQDFEADSNGDSSSVREEGSQRGASSETGEREGGSEEGAYPAENQTEGTEASRDEQAPAPETDSSARKSLEASATEAMDKTSVPEDIGNDHTPQEDHEMYLPDTKFVPENVNNADRATKPRTESQSLSPQQSPRDGPPTPPPKDTSPATPPKDVQRPRPESQEREEHAILPSQGFEFQFGTQDQTQEQDRETQQQDLSILSDAVYKPESLTSHEKLHVPRLHERPQHQQDKQDNIDSAEGHASPQPSGAPGGGYVYDEASGDYYPANDNDNDAILDDARYDGERYDGPAYSGRGYEGDGYDDDQEGYGGQADDGQAYDGQAYDGQGYASEQAYDSEEEERLWQQQQQQQKHQQQQQQQQQHDVRGVGLQGIRGVQADQRYQQRQGQMVNAF